MKIALSLDKDRIAPVFDVAQDCICYEISQETVNSAVRLAITRNDNSDESILRLAEEGVEILICGAISRQLQLLAENNGIMVAGFLTGQISEILATFLGQKPGKLSDFVMPGCRHRVFRQNRQRLRKNCRFQSS
ncbi:MAG: NifB/NifX family molybdenum-iron cluster-binding protein [Candidatus Rifleibacteriota bacterium]